MSNVITSLIFGRRFEYDDPRFLKLLDLIQEGVKEESGFLREVRGEGLGATMGRLGRAQWKAGLCPAKAPWGEELVIYRGASQKGHFRTGACKKKGLGVGKSPRRERGEAGQGQPAPGES